MEESDQNYGIQAELKFEMFQMLSSQQLQEGLVFGYFHRPKIKNIVVLLLFLVFTHALSAQVSRLAGPRLGVTFLTEGSAADVINEGIDDAFDGDFRRGVGGGAVVSQFGWQWESRFADGGGSITGIVEWIA